MKWLRKAKNSAILVDVLLVVILFLAAIGFASFVHLRSANNPVATADVGALDIQSESQVLLGVATLDDSSLRNSSQPQYASVATPNPLTVTVLPAISMPCDVIKKLQLKNTYEQNVRSEDARHEAAIKGLRILNPAMEGGDAQRLLNPEHLTKLKIFNEEYLKQLAAINCPL